MISFEAKKTIIKMWEASARVEEISSKLGLSVVTVKNAVFLMRKAGIKLKRRICSKQENDALKAYFKSLSK